jgi:hypothetical protein
MSLLRAMQRNRTSENGRSQYAVTADGSTAFAVRADRAILPGMTGIILPRIRFPNSLSLRNLRGSEHRHFSVRQTGILPVSLFAKDDNRLKAS